MNDPRTWLVELLEQLERHAQLMQANTAAVRSLETILSSKQPEAAGADVQKVRSDFAQQLEQAAQVIRRLEQLTVFTRETITSEESDGKTQV